MTEKCVICGLRWHVCKDKVIPPGGYVCPPLRWEQGAEAGGGASENIQRG